MLKLENIIEVPFDFPSLAIYDFITRAMKPGEV
jgi:hypothetical protein